MHGEAEILEESKSVLGISYDLYRILTGQDEDGFAKEILFGITVSIIC